MDKEDARKQSLGELHERRKQVIRLYQKGQKVMAIVELTGLSWPTVRSAINRYEAGGAVALKPKERGKKHGEGRSLTAAQKDKIRKLIRDKRPEQLKMDFALWTHAAVMLLIERECAIKLSVRAIGNYLKRWGFTPQKPIKRAMSSVRKPSSNGSTRNIRRSRNARRPKGARFIGATRWRWSIPTFAVAAMRPRARRLSPLLWGAVGNYR